MDEKAVQFGQEVTDSITGFRGFVTGRTTYITGCTQVLVQPRVAENGEFREPRWIDEDRLDVISAAQVGLARRKHDGPDIPAPIR